MNFFVALLFTILHTCVSLRFNEAGITQVVENVEDGDEGRRRRRRRRRRRKTNIELIKSGETLIKEGVECKSAVGEVGLGDLNSLSECTQKCKEHSGCKYFIYGTGVKAGKCYMEGVASDDCGAEGFETDSFNFYKLVSDVGKGFEPGKNNPTNAEFILTLMWTDALRDPGVVVSAKKAAFVTAIIAAIDEPVFDALGRIQGGGSSEPSIATVNAKLKDVLTAVEIKHFNKLQGSSLAELSHSNLITFRISFPENSAWATTSQVLDSQYETVFSDTVFMQEAKTALEGAQASAGFTEFCCDEVSGLVGSKTSYIDWESSMILGVERSDVEQKDADGADADRKVTWLNLGFKDGGDDIDNNEAAMGFGNELRAGLAAVFDIVTSHKSGSVLIRDVQVVQRLVQARVDIEFNVYTLDGAGGITDLASTNAHKTFYDNVIASKVTGLRLALATAVAKDLKLPLLPAYDADIPYTGLETSIVALESAPTASAAAITAANIKDPAANAWKLKVTFRYLAYGGVGAADKNTGGIISAADTGVIATWNADTKAVTKHAASAVPATYTMTTAECINIAAPCAGKVITFIAGTTNRVPATAVLEDQTDVDGAVDRRGADEFFTAADPNYVRVTYTVRLYDAYSEDITKKIKSCRDASAFDQTLFGTSLKATLAASNLKPEWGITVSKVTSEPLGKIHLKTA